MRRILVCGGRDFTDQERAFKILDQSLKTFKEVHLIQGGASGADLCAKNWALSRGIEFTEYPAEWDKYGKRAGYIRNTQMLNEGKPDIVVAFPGGKGTQMMINLAKAANVHVIEVQ